MGVGRNEVLDTSPAAYEHLIRERAAILTTALTLAPVEVNDELHLLHRSALGRIDYEESEGWIMDEIDDSDQFWETGYVEARDAIFTYNMTCWLTPATD